MRRKKYSPNIEIKTIRKNEDLSFLDQQKLDQVRKIASIRIGNSKLRKLLTVGKVNGIMKYNYIFDLKDSDVEIGDVQVRGCREIIIVDIME